MSETISHKAPGRALIILIPVIGSGIKNKLKNIIDKKIRKIDIS